MTPIIERLSIINNGIYTKSNTNYAIKSLVNKIKTSIKYLFSNYFYYKILESGSKNLFLIYYSLFL